MLPFLPALLTASLAAGAAPVDFVREVRPILEKHCYQCHGPEKQKNGFRLDQKRAAFHDGDDHAPNLVAGKSAESPLYRFVSGADAKVVMPPKGKGEPLGAEEIALLKRWLDEGAIWPDGVDGTSVADRSDWWSFKPLPGSDGFQPAPSGPPMAGSHRPSGVIDSFIFSKLREKGLAPSPQADRRTLIRRLYFDLLGLPPTPEEVAAFAGDENPEAYERLVDRLLASPRYGERWARHWLDVVHYGETHGYDKDKPRPNAWPYRDYVIRAFNEDKPYARFVEEQIAGDVLYPGTTDGMTALGFIAAGPWDLIGHAEVPETKIDGKIARHLDRDDMVQNTIGAFCSLTVGCAQCHNHKFDPITQEDYYSLQAVFAAVDRTDVKYYADPAAMRRFRELEQARKETTGAMSVIENSLRQKAGEELAVLNRRIEGTADKGTNPNVKPDFGYHSAISPTQEAIKWVQVDLGSSVAIDRVVLHPCYDDFNKIGAGFGFPVRFKIETSDDAEFKTGVTLLWRRHDLTFMNDFKSPGLRAFETGGAKDDGVRGRYVRVTAVKLAPRLHDFIFALAEMEVFDAGGKNLALGQPVAALDAVEAPPRWRKSNLTDGIAPEPQSADERRKLVRQRELLLRGFADAATKERLSGLSSRLAETDAALKQLPPPDLVYAGAVYTGNGAFRGTGNEGGRPRVIQVLKRGDIKNPGKEVGPGAIEAITNLAHLPFAVVADDEGARRAALSKWITDKNNPLVWRSIVNRVWQHHFGRALVDTPNDFGRMGAQPTHPELLDWLAVTFRDDLGGSLKQLHKLIVMSRTYRQGSDGAPGAPTALAIDSANTLLWRQNRRKLDAESVRDSILAVSGKLDLTMGGPGFQDFIVTHPENSPHYEYQLHDPEDPKSWRRSIYRFIVRSQQQPFMTTLDCADPSMRVDKRNESLSPLQALAMMNNGLIVAMSRHFAARVGRERDGVGAQVRRAFELSLARQPLDDELAPLVEYAKHEGLENACRVLMNLNEFSFVD